MRWAKLLAAIALVAAATSFACTLIERPGSYFDSNGQLVAIAELTSPQGIALTTLNVYVLSGGTLGVGTTISVVPKAGGSTTTITSTDGGGLSSLVSDGVSRVAWCDPSQGVLVLDENLGSIPTLTTQPSLPCDAIAISRDRLVYTTQDDASIETVHFVSIDGGGLSPAQGMEIFATHASIALTEADNYYIAGSRLTRELVPQDFEAGYPAQVLPLGAQVGNPHCELGNATTSDGLLVGAEGSQEVALYYTRSQLFSTVQVDCCDLTVDSGPYACTGLHYLQDNTHSERAAVRNGTYLAVVSTALRRSPLAAVANQMIFDGGAVIDDTDVALATNVAVDDDYMFFSSNNQIQRLSIALFDGGS
jgi:hypothetical protein